MDAQTGLALPSLLGLLIALLWLTWVRRAR